MAKKSIFKRIKDWIVGKDSKIKEANRVTNYGGGASSKSVQKEVKRSIVKAEAKKRGERQTKYQQSAVSKSNSSAFKATPPSVRKAEAKDRQTSKKSDAFNAKNAFKASAQPKFTHQSTALGTMSKRDIDTRTAKKNAYNENYKYQSRAADKLKPLIDEKYSGDTAESRRRIKSGEYQSDPNVMKYETLKHPIAMSAGRGALSGTTFGLSELGIALLPKSKEVEEAERLYQANKSKGAEFAGEMAGSLLGFGLTSGASKAAVTKLAPKTTARLGESATEYLAKNGLVRRAAEKEALRKLGTTATKEEIERFARARAAKLVAALGEDAAINLTTGAVSDVAHALIDSDDPKEFAKNMAINAGMNLGLGGLVTAAPLLRSGADSGLNRVVADDLLSRAARNVDDSAERINIRDLARNVDEVRPKAEIKAEPPKAKTLAEPKVAESLAKNSDTVLGKSVEVPSEDIIKSGEGNYGGIPIKYAPKEHSEASSWGSEIHVSDKFFQQDAATQKHILNHEIAHNWSDDFMSEHTGDWQDFTAKFVKEKEVPPSSTAYANGQRTYYEGLYGDIGATSLSETTTRAITEYLDDPDALLKRSPEAYEAVEEFVERRIGARPSAQNIDAQVDDALDELIESATTTEDFMNFFGLDRATAEILAKDKAEQASRKAVSAVEEATQNGISKGNIKPLAENLRTNKEIPRSRNREWRATPRSAKRVDTSIEGMTKQLDELKGKSWKTDRERRAIETKINDVEDRLNRAKWRREGGADMQAMRKAYRGEYAGFDMGKYTNSHQSDALEGKLKGKTATIVEMSPDEYMERAYRQIFKKPTERGEAFSRIPENQKDIEKYAEAMRNGEQFPLPYLDYSAAQQEGRHRALAAKAAGIDKIPVVIIDDEANPKAIINEVAEATAKAETKVEPPKTKTLKDRIADADDFDEFVKANTKDAEAKEYVKANKMSGLKGLWHEQRIAKHKKGIHKISIEEANEATRKAIPENVLDGWFRSANSGYKPRLMDAIAKDPDAINAGMNVAYHNYVNANPESPLPFDEWLNTPQKMYRGTHGQDAIDEDVFSAFTPDRNVAEKHAGKSGNARIEEIEVKPIDTLGSYQTTVEQEYLVPKSVVEANAPKAEAPTAEVAAEPPKTKSKKKKTPPTREERLANSNGIDQYNARAEHQAQRFEEGYEKADNIRAVLGGEEPKAPAKGAKPAAENLKTKTETSAPKTATKKEPRVIEDVGEVVHKRKAKVTRREKIKEFTESVRTKISDSLSAFEDEARKKSRDEMLDDYGAADKVRRHQTIANRSVIEHQQQWNGNRFSGEVTRNGHTFENGKSLKQIYDGMDEATEKDFDSYLLLKHAPDRIKEGKPIFDNTILKNGDSLNDPEVCRREAQKLLEKHPEFEAKAEEIYQYTQNELQNRVDAGLLSQDVADKWMKDHPFYVPTGRDMDEDFSVVYDSAVTGAQGLKAARGGDQAIRSVRDQLEYATTRNWRDMSMNNLFRRTFGEDIANELAKEADGGIEKVLDNTIDLHAGKDGKFYANVFVDGEKKSIEIEKKFYDAVQDLYKNGRLGNGIDVLNDAASIPAGVFKNLITEYSPIFMIKNFMRDFPEAFINTRQTKEFVESMLPALKDLATGGEYTQALKDAGISQSTFIDFDKALKSGKGKKNLFAIGNEYTELFPRLVEYMATFKKAGVSLKDADMALRDRAAANAADVTVNFGRSGSVGKMLNKGFVPFFNPSVQGWSKFARNLTELRHADAKTVLSFALKATALGAGAQTINNFMLQDNPNYQNISARDKANNYIFPLGDAKKTDKFLKIPSSRFAAVYGLPSVNAFNKNKMGWAEAIKVAKDQVTPIDPLESNVFSQALQIKNNQTWYGTPIVPKALEDLPKSEQYDVNTSWFGKQLGKATENLPKELQISPKKADYAIDALTGVIGDFALPASTPSKRGNSIGESIRKTAARQFTIDTVTQNNLSTRFYDKLQEANTNNQSSKGGKAEADEYKRLNGFSTEISKVNAAIKDLQGSKRETKLDDVRGMQKFRNQLMQDALDGNDAPSSNKTMNTVQKYAGTTYAINHFGKQVDKDAMKNYGKKKYGDISNAEMRKAINEDKGFFKGVKAIGNLEERIVKAGTTSNTALTRAVALAGANADDDLFGAYGAIYKSRTETANKMTRARNYFKEGGSEKEYTKLELARRTLGKLPDDQKKSELDKLEKQLAKGEVDWAERDAREKSIEYNANISYLGLAASLAQANAPARGYRLYDIKDKNIQKGINLAAMGFTARDYKEMSKALDTNGNGYPSKQEIIDYVENSGFKDKATLFDALYYYQGKSNPFGTPTKYTREQAALMGKKNGVKAISGESEDIKLNPDEGSSGNGYRGYYRGGYRRWHSWGGSRSRKGRQPISANNSAFKAKKANISGGSSPKMSVSGASNISRTSARVSSNPKIDITPLNVKAVKSAKTGRTSSNLSAALEDIQKTEKKVTPPKARRSK